MESLNGTIHTVQSGESLAEIAEKYYGSSIYFECIADANSIHNDNPIYPGMLLFIPKEPWSRTIEKLSAMLKIVLEKGDKNG